MRSRSAGGAAAGSAARFRGRALEPAPAGADTGVLNVAPAAGGAACRSVLPATAFCSMAGDGTLELPPAARVSVAGPASAFSCTAATGGSRGVGAPAGAKGGISACGAAAGGTDTRPLSVSGVTTARSSAAAAAHAQTGTRRGVARRGSVSTRERTRAANVSK